MNRKEEIKELLKYLLLKTRRSIEADVYSDDLSEVLICSKSVLESAKQIEVYINELKEFDLKTCKS